MSSIEINHVTETYGASNMTKNMDDMISKSLEVEKKLLPHMPFLLQDMWALGSAVNHIIDMIQSLNLPPDKTKVLDLGCGKGGVSVQIAAKFGYKVVGIDAMGDFLEYARKKAEEMHVGDLCQFLKMDILEYVSCKHDFDIVILASLGGILGSIKDTVYSLKNQVRANGFMLIDDGHFKEGHEIERSGYEHYKDHENTIKELTRYGDHLIEEIDTTEVSKRINEEYLKAITVRGEQLMETLPDLRQTIQNYIDLQKEECEYIDQHINGALYTLQKYE